MNLSIRCLFILATFQLAFTTTGLSQSPDGDTSLTLDIQLRVRSEWREGYKVATDTETKGDLLTVQRSRIGLTGKWKSFDYKLGAQDVRTFGNPSGATQGTVGVSEAWWAGNLTSGMRLKVGRQEIKFDNERIVGAVNWSNPGRFLDGIRWDHQAEDPKKGNSTVAVTWDELNETRRYMVYHRAMVGEINKLTFLYFDQFSETERSAITTGFTTRFRLGEKTWIATEAYVQSASDPAATPFDLRSYSEDMLIADIGLNGTGGHRWQAGLDLLSENFSPFLGTNHRHYGWMDQFYVGTPQTDGLTDIRLRHMGPLNFSPLGEDVSWGATVHHFRAKAMGDLLGNELDLWITGKKDGALTWHVGFSVLDATEKHIERQGDVPASRWSDAAGRIHHWGWVSLNFTPSFNLK